MSIYILYILYMAVQFSTPFSQGGNQDHVNRYFSVTFASKLCWVNATIIIFVFFLFPFTQSTLAHPSLESSSPFSNVQIFFRLPSTHQTLHTPNLHTPNPPHTRPSTHQTLHTPDPPHTKPSHPSNKPLCYSYWCLKRQ